MSELELRINVGNQVSGANDSEIEPQLYRVLIKRVSTLVCFGTPFNSWLANNDEVALVLQRNRKIFNFYRFYIWLIIHFGFVLNIYLIIDSYLNYENLEAILRMANLMSQLVWNASAVVLINSKFEFGNKFIRSISKRKYLNNNESTEGLRLLCFKLEFHEIMLSTSSGVTMICFNSILNQIVMLFILILSIQLIGTNDWMTFLNPILFFNFGYTAMSFSNFSGLAQILKIKFENLAKFTESNTKKSDLSKEDFVVIRKW
jgi:hypothetical protein